MQHIQAQYETVKPLLDALTSAYPDQLPAEWFSWEKYLWAVQLWYAYAMQVWMLVRAGQTPVDCQQYPIILAGS